MPELVKMATRGIVAELEHAKKAATPEEEEDDAD